MDDYYESDFKRRGGNDEEDESNLEGLKNYDYIKELIKERSQLDSESHASRLLDQGNYRLSGKIFIEFFRKIIDFFSLD